MVVELEFQYCTPYWPIVCYGDWRRAIADKSVIEKSERNEVMSEIPPTVGYSTPGAYLKPHRGTAVLVLGILGIVVCLICGIIAWVMGNNDLREMAEGRMDPSGYGMTKAGKICGMIGVILAIVGIVLCIIFMGLGILAGASGGGFGP